VSVQLKAKIILNPEEWHGKSSETVWIESLGDGLYALRNVPFYSIGISYNDIISVEIRDGENYLKFVVRRGGHSTYRIILKDHVVAEQFRNYWVPLEEIGCTYEKGSGNLFAIDVPANTDIDKAYSFLERGEEVGIWEFEEGYCGHIRDRAE